MRMKVQRKSDRTPKEPPATAGDFIRINGRNATVSASLRDKIIDWKRVDYSYDEEKSTIYISKNNESGLYKTWTNGQVFQINGIAVFHKVGVYSTEERMPVKLEGDEIVIDYSKFKVA